MQVVKSIVSSINYTKTVTLMGSPFEITVLAADAEWAAERVESALTEVKRIDKLFTSLGTESQINLINRSAGIAPVNISGELYRLIDRSLKIAALTNGAFDITYGTEFNYEKVELNAASTTVFLKEKGMRIFFGTTAQGYAADRVKYVLQMQGIGSGVIKSEGSVTTWGYRADGSQWTIGEADPAQNKMPYADFNISNMSVATSAGSHTNSALKSVSVMGTSAELAAAIAAPLAAMGVTQGSAMIDGLQQLACVFVDAEDQMHTSKFMGVFN